MQEVPRNAIFIANLDSGPFSGNNPSTTEYQLNRALFRPAIDRFRSISESLWEERELGQEESGATALGEAPTSGPTRIRTWDQGIMSPLL